MNFIQIEDTNGECQNRYILLCIKVKIKTRKFTSLYHIRGCFSLADMKKPLLSW